MGWWDDEFGHEGHMAHVFFDGTSGSAYGPEGVLATRAADGQALPHDQWVAHPAADVAGWRGQCDCGWRGQMWTRVPDLVDEDRDTRRAFDHDDSGTPPTWVEDSLHGEWQAHVVTLHDDLCPVRQDGACLCAFIATVRADQDRRRS